MENKKSTGKTLLIVLLLIVTIASLVLATYAWAKYTTTTDGEATAVVAKWDVSGQSTDLTWTKTFDHVVAQRLAPGTNGTIPVTLDVGATEVDVQYKITIVSVENKPTNLKFYTDSTKATEINPTAGTAYTGTITVAQQKDGNDVSEAIYWDWPYDNSAATEQNAAGLSGDAADTAEGEAAATMKVTLKIEAVQVQPE